MARRKPTAKAAFVLFNVVYEDGSLSSNRRVPGELLDGLDGDAPARTVIEDQDQRVGDQSGVRRPKIKSIARV